MDIPIEIQIFAGLFMSQIHTVIAWGEKRVILAVNEHRFKSTIGHGFHFLKHLKVYFMQWHYHSSLGIYTALL